MRQLSRSVTVNAPGSFALAYMNTYFLERGPHSGGAELALRFPLPRFIIDGLTLEKRVLVNLKYTASSSNSDHPLTIDWQPVGNGPLPAFSGMLAATPQTENTCTLRIAGSYTPPGRVAGALFDQFVGVRIANATITALLEQFKKSIETDYAIRLVP